MKLSLKFILILSSFILITSCSDDSVSTGTQTLDSVIGKVSYLDGSIVPQLNIQFLNTTTNRSYTGITDASGNFSVQNLTEGKYELSSQGTSGLVYKYKDTVDVNINNTRFDFILKYRYIDDQIFIEVNDNLSFIRYNTFDTKIGSAIDSINYVAGYFQGDFANAYTLSSDIYEIPAGADWTELAKTADADFIRNNYTKLASVEDMYISRSQVVIFQGEALKALYSNPSNGFAFVNTDTTRILKLPCVDRANNDIGLEIFYK